MNRGLFLLGEGGLLLFLKPPKFVMCLGKSIPCWSKKKKKSGKGTPISSLVPGDPSFATVHIKNGSSYAHLRAAFPGIKYAPAQVR